MDVNGCRIFHHGTPTEDNQGRGKGRGRVAIVLGAKGVRAWERAGQPDPIPSGIIVGCACYIALPLTLTDHNGAEI